MSPSLCKVALFGGSGGLGKKLVPLLGRKYDVIPVSSKDVNVHDATDLKVWCLEYRPDIVINASGTNRDGQLHKYKLEDIKAQIETNIYGLVNIIRASVPIMRDNGRGRIIHFSSILARKPLRGTSIYSATKAFSDNLIRTAAQENARYGITVNSLQLGYFDGGLTYKVPSKVLESVLKSVPLGRLGTIEELYNTIDFLINTEYVTGTNLEIAGGL